MPPVSAIVLPVRLILADREINIACNLQALGISTKVFTALPANEIGDRFLTFLKQHQIDTSSICRLGDRIGLYYLENGFGCRQSEVFYDRSIQYQPDSAKHARYGFSLSGD